MQRFDEHGWLVGSIEPFSAGGAYGLLSPRADSRVDAGRWQATARRFFGAEIALRPEKDYPAGGYPLVDALEIEVGRPLDRRTRVAVVTLPLARAADVQKAAERGVRAIGGAGFEVLLRRAQRLWQVSVAIEQGGDERAPLLVAALLAAVLLAPVVPPDEETIFGVKGARERLSKRGLG